MVSRLFAYQSSSSGLENSEKEMSISFFFINSRPKEPGPQLLAMEEEAFCR